MRYRVIRIMRMHWPDEWQSGRALRGYAARSAACAAHSPTSAHAGRQLMRRLEGRLVAGSNTTAVA